MMRPHPARWILGVCLALGASLAQATSFDCSRAKHPVELAICADPDLSHADEAMAQDYRILTQSCGDPPARAAVRATQRAWLTARDAQFSPDALPAFKHDTLARAAALATQVAQCRGQAASSRPRVQPLTHPKLKEVVFPFVESPQPEVSARINTTLFGQYDMGAAPKTVAEAQTRLGIWADDTANRPPMSLDYTVLRNDGRLLVLEFAGEGCGAYCSNFTEQLMFDARSGRRLVLEDVFSDAGMARRSAWLKRTRVQRARAIVAHGAQGWEADERETYARCIREWQAWEAALWPLELKHDGHWHFRSGTCSAHVNRSQDALDDLGIDVTTADLRADLSPYGRSLLLGEGDVREAGPTAPQCGPATPAPLAPGDLAAFGGENHRLLLSAGRLWAWGDNNDGQLGAVPTPDGQPVLVGTDFIAAGAGQNFSAGIRRDGSLWTWGSNYAARLGDGGTQARAQPGRIGEHFAALALDSYEGLALQADGTLWTWGGERLEGDTYRLSPRTLATDVAHIQYGPRGERLAVKKDGSLWAWGGFAPEGQNSLTEARLIGTGVTGLLGRHGAQLAVKADGTLWTWGETAAAFADPQAPSAEALLPLGRNFVRASVSDAPQFIVALKADGSLWATHPRGPSQRLEPIGCGYADAVVVSSTHGHAGGAYVLALRRDGELVAWGNWRFEPNWQFKRLFDQAPKRLGRGYARLVQIGNLWGSLGAHTLLVGQDGSVWEWIPPLRDGNTTQPARRARLRF